jgi:hypothetical protein
MIGLDIYDCVCVINSREALNAFAKTRVALGSDLAVVAGPYGAGGAVEMGMGVDGKKSKEAKDEEAPPKPPRPTEDNQNLKPDEKKKNRRVLAVSSPSFLTSSLVASTLVFKLMAQSWWSARMLTLRFMASASQLSRSSEERFLARAQTACGLPAHAISSRLSRELKSDRSRSSKARMECLQQIPRLADLLPTLLCQ